MHESYVSLEIAKLLKKLGFKWGCRAAWDLTFPDEPYLNYDAVYQTDFNNDVDDILYAPTLEVAQRWLREVKDIDVYIFPTTNNKRGCVYEWGIKTFGRALWVEGQPYTNQYETYEEAQEEGIKKALEMILEKGE